MSHPAARAHAEESEIAKLFRLPGRHGMAALPLVVRVPRQGQALLEQNLLHERRAVVSRDRSASPEIGRSQQ